MADILNPFEGVEIDRVFLSRAELSEPWGIQMPSMPNMLLFHLVVKGAACIRFSKAKDSHKVSQGQLSLIPYGDAHEFFDGTSRFMTPLFDLPREEITSHYEVIKHGGKGQSSLTFCGAVRLNNPLAQLLINGLPKLIVISDWTEQERTWAENTFEFLFREAYKQDFLSKEIIMHLSEILVFQGIRNWFSQSSKNHSILRAISDERIIRVINAVQKEPSEKWTTLDMAKIAGMSRSAFSQKFVKLLGINPSNFVREIKINLAETYFRKEGLSIGEVARRLSYESEAAFARAYKRVKGVSPGKIKGKQLIG